MNNLLTLQVTAVLAGYGSGMVWSGEKSRNRHHIMQQLLSSESTPLHQPMYVMYLWLVACIQ